ncbi:MAG TPA: GyrI-like domain-containing protein [Roseiflexaceae bacterium]|nr:GyrI-like domain-containing protein [Roseiflexaceae bacterium]
MKTTPPTIDERAPQPYAGIRTQVSHREFPTIIPKLLDETFGWLAQQAIAPAGAPFMRYHVIDMDGLMDVELGVPVAEPVAGNGRVGAGVLPAGRYASLIYTGVENGIAGNAMLIGWARDQGLRWDQFDSPHGDGFVSRYEVFLTGPDDDPDPANWDTEVAIKLAE